MVGAENAGSPRWRHPPSPRAALSPGTVEKDGVMTHAEELLQVLREAGVKLVCIDFDATFVRVHTGGTWTQSAEELSKHVRELFLALVPRMCEVGIHVAVVTFSPQVDLIRAVLKTSFGDEVAARLILRCDDPSWTLAQGEAVDFVPRWQVCGMHADRAYKLPYVISAALEASKESGEVIRNRDTILIDDDAKNVRIAVDNGITGIYFEPEGADVKELCRRIKKLHVQPQSATPPTFPTSPMKRKAVRLMVSPESRLSSSARCETPLVARVPRTKKFSLCTPSPVMKLKCTVDMGRPRSKRATRLRNGPRSIEEEMQQLRQSELRAEQRLRESSPMPPFLPDARTSDHTPRRRALLIGVPPETDQV
ncbi:hypothetical protein Poli38472_009172 [Pythium oligandrum]|uniref:ATP-binding Cassette (ABC) superfamily n=1 Tax=Pythium oligandrum TaxID=41045 RepID=A0A8K1CKN1_PYTOL|nr:hypothetical protein Poli38472_009172 [Pythium oligandrum]|eukprot:TMW65005.1 hypothetical protein Poli38472_009172 [Pythium oligandrum]